jgi:hypothetical protein
LTSCHFHTFRNYSINDQFEIKRKFADKDRTKISKYSVSSQTKRYYLPRVICEDSVKLREISTKVFKSNHKEFLHNYFDNCKLLKMNDTLEKFDYDYRIIHGTDETQIVSINARSAVQQLQFAL